MPATIPSHPAAVLPLKLWRPRRFDGVALVVGSAAPDVVYAGALLVPPIHGHAWHAVVWWCLPVTLAIVAPLRWAAPYVAAHLPAGGWLALRDYGVLGRVRHPFLVTACSAMLGGASHVLWDAVTHPYVVAVHPFLGGMATIDALRQTAVAGLPWWRVLHLLSEVSGTAVVVACAVHIGRTRALLAWHGPAPEVRRRPALFWSVTGGLLVALVTFAAVLPGNGIGPNVVGVRFISAVALAVLGGAAAVAVQARRSGDGRSTASSEHVAQLPGQPIG